MTDSLLGATYVYDNPITNRREFWRDGEMYSFRHREFCDGFMHHEWGTYSEKPPIPYD